MTLIIHQQEEIEIDIEGDYVVIRSNGLYGSQLIPIAKENIEPVIQAIRENAAQLLKDFYEQP